MPGDAVRLAERCSWGAPDPPQAPAQHRVPLSHAKKAANTHLLNFAFFAASRELTGADNDTVSREEREAAKGTTTSNRPNFAFFSASREIIYGDSGEVSREEREAAKESCSILLPNFA